MYFKERRLIFQDRGGASAAPSEGRDEQSVPRNYYDPETHIYYDEDGHGASMSPQQAEAQIAEIAASLAFTDESLGHESVLPADEASGQRVEAADEAARQRVKLDTEIGLAAVKDKLGDDFAKVTEILKGKRMTGEIRQDQLADGLIFLGGEEAFRKTIGEKFTPEDLKTLKEVLAKFYTFTDSEFPDFLPKVASAATIGIFKSELEKQYPHILTFDRFKSDACALQYDFGFDGTNVALKFSLPSGFQELYDQHVIVQEAQAKAATEEKARADEVAAKAAEVQTGREQVIEQMKQHPIGALLVDFFGTAPEGQKSVLDKLIDGEAKVLAILLGAVGVPYFAGKYENARKMASSHPKLKKLFDEVDARVKPLKIDVQDSSESDGETQASRPSYPTMDARKFQTEVVEKGVVGDGGVQLSKNYVIPSGKKLTVDLSSGTLVLPAGKSMNVDGRRDPEAATGGKDREFKETTLILVKDIPKGTILTKGAKLELV